MSEAQPAAGKRRPQPEDLERLLYLIAEGDSLRAACLKMRLDPPSTNTWLDEDDGRRQQYARAREMRAEFLAEKALNYGFAAAKGDIKPDGARVAIDAIKWAAGRMAPKTAPVQRVALSYENLTDEEIEREIAARMAADDAEREGE